MQNMARRRWTSQEDGVLSDLIRRYGDKRGREGRWHDIAKFLPGRTPKNCRKRWFHSLDPSVRKGRWTQEEDQILLREFSRLGPAWKEIALLLPGRKDDQCAKRYTEVLAPSVNGRLRKWAPEEDEYLRAKVRELGHSWSIISAGLPGRPPLTCRNRWRALSKKHPDISQLNAGCERAESTESPTQSFGTETDLHPPQMHQNLLSNPAPQSTECISPIDMESLETFLGDTDFAVDLSEFELSEHAEPRHEPAISDLAITGHVVDIGTGLNDVRSNTPSRIPGGQAQTKTVFGQKTNLESSAARAEDNTSNAERAGHSHRVTISAGNTDLFRTDTTSFDELVPATDSVPVGPPEAAASPGAGSSGSFASNPGGIANTTSQSATSPESSARIYHSPSPDRHAQNTPIVQVHHHHHYHYHYHM